MTPADAPTTGARGRIGPRPLALHLLAARRAAAEGQTPDLLTGFVAGVQRYWRHPYRRPADRHPLLWSAGTTRLLDYGPADGQPLLVVPSLVNRAYILDLLPERSLLRHLAGRGLRPLLVDWGVPGPAERRMNLDAYILERLGGALDGIRAAGLPPPILLGYCMGGLLALALALQRPREIKGLAVLATPWDFHAGIDPRFARSLAEGPLPALAGAMGGLPVDHLQSMFAALDPLAVPRKFVRFARHPEDETLAFVAVEDWVNDGVPLAGDVAAECLAGWYGDNLPVREGWRVDGRAVRPGALAVPALVALPARDRIVPPASAAALVAALPQPSVLRPPGGHIGMVVGAGAPSGLWQPLASWLRRIAAMRK